MRRGARRCTGVVGIETPRPASNGVQNVRVVVAGHELAKPLRSEFQTPLRGGPSAQFADVPLRASAGFVGLAVSTTSSCRGAAGKRRLTRITPSAGGTRTRSWLTLPMTLRHSMRTSAARPRAESSHSRQPASEDRRLYSFVRAVLACARKDRARVRESRYRAGAVSSGSGRSKLSRCTRRTRVPKSLLRR
jgi:hypothetical protein